MRHELLAYIATIQQPCRLLCPHPELQTREDITVYLVHAFQAELLAFPVSEQITTAQCNQWHARVRFYWPDVVQRNRFIAIFNAFQRVRNPAYGRDPEFACWLKEQESLKIPA